MHTTLQPGIPMHPPTQHATVNDGVGLGMRTALSMLTLLIPVCSDIPGKSVKRSVRVYKLACLDIHICKFSTRKCSFIVKGENPFRGENIWGLLQKHPHLHNIWVPLHEFIQLSYKRSPFRLIPKILARLEIFQSYCIVPPLPCALCSCVNGRA